MKKRAVILTATTHIRNIIRQNQLEGAIVEAYSPNIVARLLGLAEKKELKGEDGSVLVVSVTSQDTKDKLQKLQESLQKE